VGKAGQGLTLKVLHTGNLPTCPQIPDRGKPLAALKQGSLVCKIINYVDKKFCNGARRTAAAAAVSFSLVISAISSEAILDELCGWR